MNSIYVVVDGNIGSGKSTLLKKMGQVGFKVHMEPIQEWQYIDCGREQVNLLDLCYKNPSKWAFPFQIHAFTTMMRPLKKNNDPMYICERSIWSSRNIFCEALYEDGSLSCLEYFLLNELFEKLTAYCSKPDITFYIRTDPKVVLHRVVTRCRMEEVGNVTLTYLQSLHKKYDKFYRECKQFSNIVENDGNNSMDAVFQEVNTTLYSML